MGTALVALLEAFDDEVNDADEETFYLFSQSPSSRNLGMVDGKAAELDITIGDRDYAIRQSPGILQSRREGGTTGAAVWECSVRFAEWLGSDRNPLFARDVLGSGSSVLELGAGISGLVPVTLGPRVARMIATDQQYALALLRENIQANVRPGAKGRRGAPTTDKIDVEALDWETDDFKRTVRSYGLSEPFDAVVACDCVFNYALISPFVEACANACKFGRNGEDDKIATTTPAVCLVAQQLRQPDVFQQWLEAFATVFRVWRVPDAMLTDKLREGSGFVVHLGVLR